VFFCCDYHLSALCVGVVHYQNLLLFDYHLPEGGWCLVEYILSIKKGRLGAGPKHSHRWEVGDYLTALATGFLATFLAAGFLAAGFLAAALVVFAGLFIAVTLVARV